MLTRIIARLDVKPPFVVKPVHFEGLRKIGKPEDLAMKYYEQGADEILYMDIVASLYRRNIILDRIKDTAKDIFIPFAAGGGIRSINDFSSLLHEGVDKVVINTFALQTDPQIIKKASDIFGSQAVVVQIDAKKWLGYYEAYSDCGRIRSNHDVLAWAQQAEGLGAGEILLSSVDQDGRQRGFDLHLVKEVVDKVDIPVIAASGAGSPEDIKDLITYARPSAVAIGSILHYNQVTIREIKQYLTSHNIRVAQ